MINTTEFNTRLKKILEYYGLSASAFAEVVTVQRSSISHILSGRNKPSLDFISKVLNAFPEIDLRWLLSGTGDFTRNTTPPLAKTEKSQELAKPTNPVATISSDDELIERIVIFYKDGSFKNYAMTPSK